MLVVVHAVAGFVLGCVNATWALALLVGAVSVTTSLWWQIGMRNVATPIAYVGGMLVGLGLRWFLAKLTRADRKSIGSRIPEHILVPAGLTITFTLLATTMAILERHAGSPAMLAARLTSDGSAFFDFNAWGLAGELQAAFIAVMGPILLLVATVSLQGRAASAVMCRAFIFGMFITVVGPVVQLLLLNPWVRPDRGAEASTGLVGFFQDPHSYAAVLVLMIGMVAGLLWSNLRAGKTGHSVTSALLILAAVVALIGTNSRTGILALLVIAAGMTVMSVLERRAAPAADLPHRWLVVSFASVVGALILTLAVVVVPQVREVTYEGLRNIGARRLAQPLGSDADWSELLGARPARWRQAVQTIERRPLWGSGPHSIQETPVEPTEDLEPGEAPAIAPDNTHNYFLQFSAEYGVPSGIALLALLAGTLSWTVRGALHHPSPRSRSLLAGIASGQIGFLIFGIVSHPMLLAECQALFWTLSGFAIATVETPGN